MPLNIHVGKTELKQILEHTYVYKLWIKSAFLKVDAFKGKAENVTVLKCIILSSCGKITLTANYN